MNYTEIIDSAVAYADRRQDADIASNMGVFIKVVESRINQVLQVQKMVTEATIPTNGGEFYGLPVDFSGLRDIEIAPDATSNNRTTLAYLSPEQLNQHAANSGSALSYTVIANQIHIYPPSDNTLLRIIYYQKLPPLSDKDPENWLSIMAPEAYIFGILIEISAFLKDDNAADMWQSRFSSAIDGLKTEDSSTRWSGTALQVRVG